MEYSISCSNLLNPYEISRQPDAAYRPRLRSTFILLKASFFFFFFFVFFRAVFIVKCVTGYHGGYYPASGIKPTMEWETRTLCVWVAEEQRLLASYWSVAEDTHSLSRHTSMSKYNVFLKTLASTSHSLSLCLSLSLFGQQRFLKNVFFREVCCFCLFILYGCPLCARGSVVDHSDTLTTRAFLVFFFFFFTFCKLRGEKKQTKKKQWSL